MRTERLSTFLRRYLVLVYLAVILLLDLLSRWKAGRPPLTGTMSIYLVVILVAFLMALAARRHPVDFFGLNPSRLAKGKLWPVLPVAVLSNLYLYLHLQHAEGEAFQLQPEPGRALWQYLTMSAHIRFFGEEIFFRGPLQAFHEKPLRIFWLANITQALIFAGIHAAFPNPWPWRGFFACFAFTISLLYGVLNRWSRSVLPGFLLHATNSILTGLILKSTS